MSLSLHFGVGFQIGNCMSLIFTVLSPSVVPHEVGIIHFANFGSIVHFSWNETFTPNGCPVEYLINSANCGVCPRTSAVTYVSCPYEETPTQRDCTLMVSMKVCGISGSPTTQMFPGPTIPTRPTTNGNAPLSGNVRCSCLLVI